MGGWAGVDAGAAGGVPDATAAVRCEEAALHGCQGQRAQAPAAGVVTRILSADRTAGSETVKLIRERATSTSTYATFYTQAASAVCVAAGTSDL